MKMIKKSIACIASAAMMLSGAGALTANAYITNYPNQFILTYATGAPSTDIQTTLTNYASMGSSDPAITIQVTSCATSSNTCELVRTNTSQGYGDCHFNGTAN